MDRRKFFSVTGAGAATVAAGGMPTATEAAPAKKPGNLPPLKVRLGHQFGTLTDKSAAWVARYGVPANLTSDRGVQFTSATWTDWCSEYGVRHIPTTAFHPQANGMVERLHRSVAEPVHF